MGRVKDRVGIGLLGCGTDGGGVLALLEGNADKLALRVGAPLSLRRVLVRDLEKDEEVSYQLVTAEESDAALGMISTTSPIGRAFLGKQEGDVVNVRTPAGAREFEIVQLKTIYDV